MGLFGAAHGWGRRGHERTTIKSILPLQPEHGFCREKGPEHGQVLVGIRMKK